MGGKERCGIGALAYLFLPFVLPGLMPTAYPFGRALRWLIFR